MDAATDELMVSAAELAEDFRISDVELGRLARKGIIPRTAHPTERRTYLHPLRRCFRAYVSHLKSEELMARQILIEGRSKQARAKTKREELLTEIQAGVMVRRDHLLAALEPLLTSYRQAVLSRPSRLERRISRAKSREARVAILEEDARETLATLGEMLQNGRNGQNGQSPKKKGL
jgi:hypothetical protein